MKKYHATLESARAVPFLRSWERDNDLTYGPSALRFEYKDCEIAMKSVGG